MDQTLYWLFSTIAQSYGAIIGFIGLLVVYRLDNQSRRRESIEASLMANKAIKETFINVKVTGWSAEDISYHYHNPEPGLTQNLDTFLPKKISIDLKDGITRIDNSVKRSTAIREKFKSFVTFHFLVLIIVPIILIYLVPIFFPDGQTLVWPITIFITVLVILIVVLSISCKMIWSMAMTLLDEEKKGR